MSQDAIVVDQLNHYFGEGELRRQVLHDVSVRIGAGEIVILTGPSGSGKTTLLTLMGALRSAQEGSLQVLGHELRGAREEGLTAVRRRIGYVFQAHNLLESLTARRNVRMSLELDASLSPAELESRAAEALAAVGLGERADAHPSELSGGQRQRVAIARALARRPALVLADEPTASLDRQTGRTIVELLERLARHDGVTVVLVTHDSRILDVADRILTLEDGRLSSLMSAVAGGSEQMLRLLVRDIRRGELGQRVRALDERGFRELLDQVTGETRRLLELVDLVQGDAFESMLEQVLGAFASKLAELLGAQRATLFLVDDRTGELFSYAPSAGGPAREIRAPLDGGVVGLAARTKRPARGGQALDEGAPDARTEAGARGLLAVPVVDSKGRVFAVVELADGRAGSGFGAADEARLAELTASLGLILESWWRMSCACRSRAVGVSCPYCGASWHSPRAAAPSTASDDRGL
jgi:putative ABC transport system ATP-binding protein